jgi:hypothetical protein
MNVNKLNEVIPFCHSKKIISGISIQTHSGIGIERGLNGE